MVKKWIYMNTIKKNVLRNCFLTVGCVFVTLLSFELTLRLKMGLCDAPLSILSDKYEYCFAPNQDRMRFGNRVKYNSKSMRCEEIDEDAIKVIVAGDSVVNGGVLVDQTKIATTLLTERLTKRLGQSVQVLNVSAGSWGPENCANFLEEKGLFDAKGIVVALSGYDIQDFMTFDWEYYTNSVNKVHMPLKQYPTALEEFWKRYRRRAISKVYKALGVTSKFKSTYVEPDYDYGRGPDPGYGKLVAMAADASIPIVYYLHPVTGEIKTQEYSIFSVETLKHMTTLGVQVVEPLLVGFKAEYYLDGIHLNEAGHAKMADILEPILLEMILK